MDSPKKLKHKLDHVIIELENTKESLRNVLDREKHFQISLRKTIRELKDECLISQETARRLDAFCLGCRRENTDWDWILWRCLMCSVCSWHWWCSSVDPHTPSLSPVITDSTLDTWQHHALSLLAKNALKMCRHMLWLCFCVTGDNYVFTVLGHYCKMVRSHKSKELYQVGHISYSNWNIRILFTTHIHLSSNPRCFSYWSY